MKTQYPNLRESCALSPDVTVLADNCGGGEALVVPEIAHQVVVDVGLPRHLRLLSSASSVVNQNVVRVKLKL